MSSTAAKPAVGPEHTDAEGGVADVSAAAPDASLDPDAASALSPTVSVVEDVREVVVAVSAGSVVSYGDIGRRVGAGPRQVGRAMSLIDDAVPWWRVVYADGTPATCHGGRALELLADDATPMLGARVDMDRARHRGPSEAGEGGRLSDLAGKTSPQ